jgi:hypothetical protein
MRKIQLSLDALAVESFSTAGRDEKGAGTVHAHATEYPAICNFSQGTCFQSCGMTNTSPCIKPYC